MELHPNLPRDLAEVERRLAALRPKPHDRLRQRVAAAVAGELRRSGGRPVWRWAGWAAAAMLLVNLSLSATSSVDSLRTRDDARSEATIRQVNSLVPEFSPREAAAVSFVLRHGTSIVPRPSLPGERNSR